MTTDRYDNLARTLLANALSIPVESISGQASIQTQQEWSSLSHMRLLVAIESQLDVTLPPESILEITSLGGIVDLLKRFDETPAV